jgi:hypothetical protein
MDDTPSDTLTPDLSLEAEPMMETQPRPPRSQATAAASLSQTKPPPPIFDFTAYPENTVFYERRTKNQPLPVEGGRVRQERRKRVDPCTFEKQYSVEETEFMNAMQAFKNQSGKPFPTYGEVLMVARKLGYRKTGPVSPLPGNPAPPGNDEEF